MTGRNLMEVLTRSVVCLAVAAALPAPASAHSLNGVEDQLEGIPPGGPQCGPNCRRSNSSYLRI